MEGNGAGGFILPQLDRGIERPPELLRLPRLLQRRIHPASHCQQARPPPRTTAAITTLRWIHPASRKSRVRGTSYGRPPELRRTED